MALEESCMTDLLAALRAGGGLDVSERILHDLAQVTRSLGSAEE